MKLREATGNLVIEKKDLAELCRNMGRLRGDLNKDPDASIIIPVNAQGDIANLLSLLEDIADYRGKHTFEVLPVINNYSPDEPPVEIQSLSQAGVNVVGVPDARRPGEKVGFSARIPGLHAACSNMTIHFDADCRVPNSTALLDYYVDQLSNGIALAYTPVLYYDLPVDLSVQIRVAIHNTVRWMKRNLLNIPTARGSNYAIDRELMLSLYDTGNLTEDFQIGPNIKEVGAKHTFSGDRKLAVRTSGRKISRGWSRLFSYVRWRFFFNLRLLKDTAAARTLKKSRKDYWK